MDGQEQIQQTVDAVSETIENANSIYTNQINDLTRQISDLQYQKAQSDVALTNANIKITSLEGQLKAVMTAVPETQDLNDYIDEADLAEAYLNLTKEQK